MFELDLMDPTQYNPSEPNEDKSQQNLNDDDLKLINLLRKRHSEENGKQGEHAFLLHTQYLTGDADATFTQIEDKTYNFVYFALLVVQC